MTDRTLGKPHGLEGIDRADTQTNKNQRRKEQTGGSGIPSLVQGVTSPYMQIGLHKPMNLEPLNLMSPVIEGFPHIQNGRGVSVKTGGPYPWVECA